MKYTIKVGDDKIVLEYNDFENNIDIQELTTIDSTNVYGENSTISSDLNRIGLLKAEVEANMANIKLDVDIYEGSFIEKLRLEASNNSGKYKVKVDEGEAEVKLTETGLKTSFHTDDNWIKLKRSYIESEKNFNALNSLYWSIQDKSNRLSPLQKGTNPEEYKLY